ncbi:hypothetical protein SLNWT_1667 [Streptomyces albus]|uniref:Uncharacterized protein n=1 Tax=Streptomyces albus (strain ATCC 21838 / DSM 41398 / FERM P-419 / JCM 4703 / NBRC 107858) TaxID=1081613 RepID=A0A0B5EIH7_STRA4|nr:hypothetical protein SLNWT_1667 [Streptomyces albus]
MHVECLGHHLRGGGAEDLLQGLSQRLGLRFFGHGHAPHWTPRHRQRPATGQRPPPERRPPAPAAARPRGTAAPTPVRRTGVGRAPRERAADHPPQHGSYPMIGWSQG